MLDVNWVNLSANKSVAVVNELIGFNVEYTLNASPSIDDAQTYQVEVILNISYEGGPFYPAVSRVFPIQESVRHYTKTIQVSFASPGSYNIYAEANVIPR